MILITGASGTVGKAVLAAVVESGAKYRAMYRAMDRPGSDTAQAPPGGEIAIADFADKGSLAAALKGVESVFLVCSPVPQLVELESNMIDACERAGVRRIVLNSALGAGDYEKSFPSWHRQVEDRLKATKMASCVLRTNTFLQNLVAFYAPSIRARGEFYSSMGDSRTSYLDVRDIAGVAVKALRGEFDGKTYELNGPEALTCTEVADRIAKHAGVPARYVDIPFEAQRKSMLEMGMPEWQVTALLDLQQYYTGGHGGTVDGVVDRLLGRPAITIDSFVKEFAAEFRSSTAAA